MKQFDSRLKEWQKLVEGELYNSIDEKDLPQATVYKAMRYSLEAGGKRLRPVLMLAVADIFQINIDKVMPYACALEMIHTYSLIHDDLPAMDNDDLRRGKPTNHRVFGEAMAILAGDGLLNNAFEMMINTALKSEDPKKALKAMSVIAEASGIRGMIGGQVVDIEAEGRNISEHLLAYMHSKKTGALIMAAVLVPAYLAGASDEKIKLLTEYSRNLGIAFQIKDDLLDVEGNSELLGKPIGSDAINEKTTYVTLYGLEGSKKLLNRLTCDAIESLNPFGKKAEFLKELALYLLSRET